MDISIPQGAFKVYTLGMSERGRQTMRIFLRLPGSPGTHGFRG